jgi:hypothetical protein
MYDSVHATKFENAIGPLVVADNTAEVGAWIDRSGFQSLTFAIQTGAIATNGATFAVTMDEADAADYSDAEAVDTSDQISSVIGEAPETAASFTGANANSTFKIGYIGTKRYVRLTITPTSNSGNAALAATAVLGHAAVRPV